MTTTLANTPTSLAQQPWLVNTLLDDVYLSQKAQLLSQSSAPHELLAWLNTHFTAKKLQTRNETQLEKEFIDPLLRYLGWCTNAYQVSFTVQGKEAIPDYCLVADQATVDQLLAAKDHTLIQAICESKAWGKALDTGKADRKLNPHHQLQDYLSTLRVRFGFLTNGHSWRIYDTEKITAKKTFIEFDLAGLLAETNSSYQAQGLGSVDIA